MDKFNAFSFVMRLFQAQSLLGFVSMTLPSDSSYDLIREKLFNASMAVLAVQEAFDCRQNPEGKEL